MCPVCLTEWPTEQSEALLEAEKKRLELEEENNRQKNPNVKYPRCPNCNSGRSAKIVYTQVRPPDEEEEKLMKQHRLVFFPSVASPESWYCHNCENVW